MNSSEISYLREIVEENDETEQIFSSKDTNDVVVAVRQMSIESMGDVSLKREIHSATSLEVTTTSTNALVPSPRAGSCETGLEIGLDLDQPDSTPCPASSTIKVSESANILDEEFRPVPAEEEVKVEVKIGPQHFELLKLLGEGAFGKVILVQSRLNKKLYAMKVISKRLLRKKNNVMYMKSERDILTKITHPFLFLPGGELFLHLRKRGIIQERDVQFYLGEMIIAIDFLHSKGIIHRDLKPENVLLRKDSHVCITDFGLAKEIGDGKAARTLCGTSEYMAPEMLTRNGYGKAVDWWALGALTYEMLVGKAPFTAKTQKDLDKKILTEKVSLPPYLTASAHSLLRGMLDKDMNKRLGCAKSNMFSIGGVTALKQHVFFDGLNWQRLANLELSPPIDLRTTNYTTASSSKPQSSNKLPKASSLVDGGGKDKVKDKAKEDGVEEVPPSSDVEEDNAVVETLDEDDFVRTLRYFDAEFTGQVLSRSIVEDTLTPMTGTTAAHTPRPESPNTAEAEEFVNFEYVDESVTYSKQQIEEFEELFKIKQQKATKKKMLKQKKEEIKQKEEEEKRKKLEEARKREEEEKERRKELERQRMLSQQIEQRQRARGQAVKSLAKEKQDLLAQQLVHQENVLAAQKKMKSVQKKLRDIQELKEKLKKQEKSIDKDQQAKLSKEPSLVAELQQFQQEESQLVQIRDTHDQLFVWFASREEAVLADHRKEEDLDRQLQATFTLVPPPLQKKEEVKEVVEEVNQSPVAATTVIAPSSTPATEKKVWSGVVLSSANGQKHSQILPVKADVTPPPPIAPVPAPDTSTNPSETVKAGGKGGVSEESWETVGGASTKNNKKKSKK